MREREEERSLRGLEGRRCNFAMFTRKVADLACLGLGRITRRNLAAHVGVQVAEGGGAVAISRYGLIMNVVNCYTKPTGSAQQQCRKQTTRNVPEVATYGMDPATHPGTRRG